GRGGDQGGSPGVHRDAGPAFNGGTRTRCGAHGAPVPDRGSPHHSDPGSDEQSGGAACYEQRPRGGAPGTNPQP
ncbi:hypothetical protein T484DRAFT_1923092, partial [Baffinella frigidus]